MASASEGKDVKRDGRNIQSFQVCEAAYGWWDLIACHVVVVEVSGNEG